VLKRQIAMLRAQGKIPEAIQALNKFVAGFQADASAVSNLTVVSLRASLSHSAFALPVA
jgi:hypothetical protein